MFIVLLQPCKHPKLLCVAYNNISIFTQSINESYLLFYRVKVHNKRNNFSSLSTIEIVCHPPIIVLL